MKKLLILTITLLLAMVNLEAQDNSGHLKKPKGKTYISVELGRSYFEDQVSDPGEKFVAGKFTTPTFGVLVEHELSPRWSIETGITLRRFRTSLSSDCFVQNIETSIFQVPIRFNYTLWEKGKFQLKAFAGLNTSFQDVGNSGSLSSRDFNYTFQSDGPAVLIAPELGLKLDYHVSKRLKVGVFASYVLSNRNLDRTVVNYTLENNSPIQAVSSSQGSYFQAGFRVSYLLK